MYHPRSKYVRFERSSTFRSGNGNYKSVIRRFKKVYEKMKMLENWRKIVLFVCVVALAFDPLFLFIPVVDSRRFCSTLDKKLGVAVCVLRTFIDLFYVIHIIFHFITELIAPRSQLSMRGEIVVNSKAIRKRRIFLYFIVDVVSVLPIPQVIGAFWYLSAIEKKDRCWREACTDIPGCNLTNLYCARGVGDNSRFLNTSCPLINPDEITTSTVFNFGMYIDALKSRVVESRDFPRKFFYCFWWGLRNLSALGQNLDTSNSVGEIFFAIVICVSGLLLFAVLIRNVQKYLQSTTIRVEEMEEKKRDTEKWMSYRMLPEDLKERIRRYEDYKWRETRGTEEESLLRSLPKDLRLETKRHLYLNLLKRVPWLNIMNDGWLLEAMCDRVKSVFYSANSYIMKEGDPAEEMLIVTRGKLKSMSKLSEMTGYYDASELREGDICGDLLFWVLDPHPSSRLPTSNRTVLTQTDVEGFVLLPDDLKFVASHFNRFHSNKLKHMFKFYSARWRLWAACYIQAAWRDHCKRKLSKNLSVDQTPQDTQFNLGTALYVSRFVSKTLRNRRENSPDCSSSPQMLPLVPHKPTDPDFSKDESS